METMIALLSLLPQLAIAAPAPVRFELPNGLRVWVQEDHTRPVALVQITYKAGSINETAGATGVAHYVEHMVYRATQHIRNEDVYGYIDRIGGRYTGGTWPEFTRYAETVPSWALESALLVTAERMCCALFDSTEFERERHNVITEANGYADMDPVSAFNDAVMATSFELHPYRYNSDTWARDNLVLTRDQAFRWYKDHYGPNNAVLVIVGDVDANEVRRLVEKHFASIQRAPQTGPPSRAADTGRSFRPTPTRRTSSLSIRRRAPGLAAYCCRMLRSTRRWRPQQVLLSYRSPALRHGWKVQGKERPFHTALTLRPRWRLSVTQAIVAAIPSLESEIVA
jgi:zinc protease